MCKYVCVDLSNHYHAGFSAGEQVERRVIDALRGIELRHRAFAGVMLPGGLFNISPNLTTTRPRVFYQSKTTADNTTGEGKWDKSNDDTKAKSLSFCHTTPANLEALAITLGVTDISRLLPIAQIIVRI